MGTPVNTFKGVDVEIWEVLLDVAETSFDLNHGIGGFYLAFVLPDDPGGYSQAVNSGGSAPYVQTIQKTAGATASALVILIALGARRIG